MARKSGHWFGGRSNAVVILRKTGQVLNNVTVKNATFSIETEDLRPIPPTCSGCLTPLS